MLDRLTEFSTLVAVVDAGGFAQAAHALHRSPPTVTRIIADLEARTGVRLFDRNSRRCTPTAAGRKLAEEARNLIADYEQALSSARGEAGSPKGTIRVTAPYFFGREHVAPCLLGFSEAHTEVNCELDLSDRPTDLVAEGFDVAVRIGPIADGALIARKVGSVRRVIVGSPAYLRMHGIPELPEELLGHQLIQHGTRSDQPWVLQSPTGHPIQISVRSRFTVNQADAAIAAARAGRGLVTALSYQVHADISAGTLERILTQFEPEPLAVNLVWPEGRDRLLRVRMMIDRLADHLQRLDALDRQ